MVDVMRRACELTAEMKNSYKIFTGNLKGRSHLGELVIVECIILKWILKK
jgi:hypothetical protein